eukprot:CAMPEP_0116571642 /NCGR_PEP_ID=MMETSP0397-20121206/17686_1 /TAXON_ID=216820 /ORGANISM="Cyclophora tenuis, Strain ECT3854" /LENGTH=224 /DNA_ID=CAMNT_0004099787 /DNA_START=146 /DNA_END=820 /DNA_ORIENTATION=-
MKLSATTLYQTALVCVLVVGWQSHLCAAFSVSSFRGPLPFSNSIHTSRKIILSEKRDRFSQNDSVDSNDDDQEEKSSPEERNKPSSRRMGGRARSSWIPSLSNNNNNNNNNNVGGRGPKWPILLAAFVAVWLTLSSLFGSGRDDSSYYYYQSTVVESQVRAADGTFQKSRKESVRSNIPSLIENNNKERQAAASSSSKALRSLPERDFDRQQDGFFEPSILDFF